MSQLLQSGGCVHRNNWKDAVREASEARTTATAQQLARGYQACVDEGIFHKNRPRPKKSQVHHLSQFPCEAVAQAYRDRSVDSVWTRWCRLETVVTSHGPIVVPRKYLCANPVG